MNSPVQQIKERLSIEEVVSTYIKIEKAGVNLKARCPFHNEKTASFFISPTRNNYYCFGCGAKGDIFTFVQEFEGLDFKGALKVLAQKAGVVLEVFDKKTEDEKERIYQIMELATVFFSDNLKKEKEVLDYLAERKLNEKSIQEFRIGYAENEWRNLFTHLKNKGFRDLEIEKAGLIKKSEKTDLNKTVNYYDRFRSRIIFPIWDSSGRVVAFTGRIYEESVLTPGGVGKPTLPASVGSKYLNSPETIIFNKSSVLYGLDKAKEAIRKNNFSILVEGQFDLILAHQAGFKNTVASSGTALSESVLSKENAISNLGLINRLSKNIVLAFDADKAGIKAAERASKIALALGMDVKVASLPDGMDPADLIAQNGAEAWKEAIRNSKHIIEFILFKIIKNYKDEPRKIGREIKDKLLFFVDSLESSIEKAHFIKKISDFSNIPEEALKEDLKKIVSESSSGNSIDNKDFKNKILRKDYILKRLVGIILWQKNQKKDLTSVENELTSLLNLNFSELLNNFKDNIEDLIFEAEIFYFGQNNLEKEIQELLNNFKEEYLKENLTKEIRELHLAEQEQNEGEVKKILQNINEINKKIQAIKNDYKK
jgi:DNA primase